jgi:hypothetical protein
MKEFKEVPYTIELNWETGNVELNIFPNKEKLVINKKVAQSIMNCIKLYEMEQRRKAFQQITRGE